MRALAIALLGEEAFRQRVPAREISQLAGKTPKLPGDFFGDSLWG